MITCLFKLKIQIVFILIIVLLFVCISAIVLYLYNMSEKQKYPEDTYLKTVKNKKALFFTAHDDDACVSMGTIAKLTSEGWEIRQVSFPHSDKPYKGYPNSFANPFRNEIAKTVGLKEMIYYTSKWRNDLDTAKNPWFPIPIENFSTVFNRDSILYFIDKAITEFQPSVIFTSDDSIGIYGHPDHMFISKMVTEYCKENALKSEFPVTKIYYEVVSPSMVEAVLEKSEGYRSGKKYYHTAGMPKPTVQVNIYPYSKNKMDYFTSYDEHSQKNMKKIILYYNYFPHWIYFGIFNKEYFKVVDIK